MGEMKGAIFSMFLTVAFVFPFVILILIMNVNQSGFYAITQEATDMVRESGAVDSRIRDLFNDLESRELNEVMNTYDIKVYKLPNSNSNVSEGSLIYPTMANSSLAENVYGDVFIVNYKYQYKYMWLTHNLETSHRVVVTKRNSTNVGG